MLYLNHGLIKERVLKKENYKVKVNNEAESKEAQWLFCVLGGSEHICDRFGIVCLSGGKVYTDRVEFFEDYDDCEELTLPQLRDLVVLHRNDVKDATHKYIGGGAAYKTVDDISYLWTRMGWEYKGVANDLVPLHKEGEQGLITGAEALRALADGKEVQCTITGKNDWTKDIYGIQPYYFLGGGVGQFQFRLKPRTIKIELEIPAPFEPKDGEKAYRLAPAIPCGYTEFYLEEDEYEHQFGAWRTELEIKQVVAALRGALKNG